MRVLTGIFGLALLLVFLSSSPDAMQMMMVVEEQSPEGKATGSHIIYADVDNGINMEFKYGEDHGSMVWNKAKMIAWMIDFIDGTYWTMTEEDAAKVQYMRQEMAPKMKEQQEKMKALFEEQMKGMSEEEKQAVMQHAPTLGMGMGQEQEKLYEKNGTETLYPWGNTVIYILRQYGVIVEKVWTVGWDQLGVDESYLQVFSEFGEFVGGFMEGEEGGELFEFGHREEEQGYPGLAVKKEIFDRYGELESIEIVKSIETQETDLATYQLPTDPPLEETESPFDEMPTDMPGMPGLPEF